MPTIIVLYNLKNKEMVEEYNEYLRKTKIPGFRGAPFISGFNTWRIDKVLAPAVSEPEGELPSEPDYMYIAKIEVSDMDAMMSFLGTDDGKNFVASWSGYLVPTAVMTLAEEI